MANHAKNLRRIGRATQVTEREYRNPVLPGRIVAAWQVAPCKLAVSTSSIGAGTVAAPGSGTITLYDFDSGGGTAAAGDTGITVWNIGGAIASSADLIVADVDGAWFVIVVKCPP
jgi:hypothetical protein